MKKSRADTISTSTPKTQLKQDDSSMEIQSACRRHSSTVIQPADNIASLLRRHAVMCSTDLKDRTKRNSRSQADENNCGVATPLVRRAGSVQDMSKKEPQSTTKIADATPLARTQSFQNVTKRLSVIAAEVKSDVRRTSSSQTVANHGGNTRLSAPISATMAFNAELLAAFERERRALDSRISELIQVAEFRKTETERLKIELRSKQHESVVLEEECDLLRLDNHAMRERLTELNVTVEHFTDSEKLSLLRVKRVSDNSTDQELFKLRQVSDCGESTRDGDWDAALSAGSLDGNWDRGSEGALTVGSGSEVSVACLQDRLLAMEETQYSTSEELAATLQELADLQDAVNSLTSENERLADERAIVLESLCAQTHKLENARRQIEYMKALLLRDNDSIVERSDNERQLVALLHGAEEEREELLLKQTELSNTVATLDTERLDLRETTSMLGERTRALELQLSSILLEKATLEAKLRAVTDDVELDDVDMLGGKAVSFCGETLHEDVCKTVAQSDCTQCKHLELMLAAVRKELMVHVGENSMLRNRISSIESEVLEVRTSSDLLTADMDRRIKVTERDLLEARSSAEVLRADIARVTEENRLTVSKLESELRMARLRVADAEQQVVDISERLETERIEWVNFQRDLQTAVCVAVDIRTETQEDAERLLSENCSLREREASLHRELDALRTEMSRLKTSTRMCEESTSVTGLDIRDRVINTVDRELALLRHQGRRVSEISLPTSTSSTSQPSLSVRRLISSIEQQVKAETSSSSLNRRDFPELVQTSSVVRQALQSVTENSSESSLQVLTSPRSACGALGESSSVCGHRHTLDRSLLSVTDETKCAVAELAAAVVKAPEENNKDNVLDSTQKPLTGILANKLCKKKPSTCDQDDKLSLDKSTAYPSVLGSHVAVKTVDPLSSLAKQLGGSKRNALLKWCQNRTATYTGIDITNFSSSWNDGLAFCALLHTYLPEQVPFKELNNQDKKRNFALAFRSAESVGIPSTLNMNDMLATERPDWQAVMSYVTNIYRHFEDEAKG